MRLFLIRHGETEANVKNHFYGISESKLTEKGIKQAEKTGKMLKKMGIKPDVIYVSERIRARETLKLMGFSLDEAITDARINEKNMGIIENMNYEEINERYPNLFSDWAKDSVNYTLENGESWMGVFKRVKYFLEEVIEKYRDTQKDILAVCHGGVMSAAYTRIIGDNFDAMFSAYFTNCSVLRLTVINDKLVIDGLLKPDDFIE